MNNLLATRSELLEVLKKYGIKRYYTSNYELGGVPKGTLIVETNNRKFKSEFWDVIHKGENEEDESGWVIVIYSKDISKLDISGYKVELVEED